MTAALVLPDIPKIVVDWYLADPAITALVADRVGTKSPSTPAYPYLTVQRIGGRPITSRAVDAASLQIGGWGATEGDASAVARTALASITRMVNHRSAQGVAAFAGVELGLAWAPDTVRNPPTPRFIFGVSIVAHPSN